MAMAFLDYRLSLFQNNLIVSDNMAAQKEVWAWGDYEVNEDYVLLTGDDGGYRCNYCKKKIRCTRFHVLKGHLANCTEKPDPFDEGIYKRILKFRSACDKCGRHLDLTGNKKARHLKSCKRGLKKTEEHKQEGINEQLKKIRKEFDAKEKAMSQKIKELQEKLKEEIDGKEKSEKMDYEEMYRMDQCIQELEKENEKLKDETRNQKPSQPCLVTASMCRIKELEKEIEKLKDEKGSNDKEMTEKMNELQGRKDKEINNLKEQNSKLEKECKQYHDKYDESQKVVAELKLENEKIIVENKEIARSFSEAETLMQLIRDKEKSKYQHNLNDQMAKAERLMKMIRDKDKMIEQNAKVRELDKRKIKKKTLIGQGGFGTVWRVEYDKEIIAIKTMELNHQAITELSILLKTVNKPNLLSAFLVGSNFPPGETPTISLGMEYCDGDLDKFLTHILLSSNGQINKIFVGAAQALVQLDELGIVHRDIKPKNMLLKGGKLKIADFGIAVMGRYGIGRWGTPGYIAPEVIKSEDELTYYNNKESLQN